MKKTLVFLAIIAGLLLGTIVNACAQGISADTSINFRLNNCGSPTSLLAYATAKYTQALAMIPTTSNYAPAVAAITTAKTTDLTAITSYQTAGQLAICIRRQWSIVEYVDGTVSPIDKIQNGADGVYIDPKYK